MSGEKLGSIIVKRYGTGTERGEMAEVVTYCDAPSYGLRAPDGSLYHWREDLTRPATATETVEYWRCCAETYKRLSDKLTEINSKLLDSNAELVERLNDSLVCSFVKDQNQE